MSNTDQVGYKNPPKQGQWKKGQSGNPSGKKKAAPAAAKSLLYWIADKLQEFVETTQNGVKARTPAGQVIATIILHKITQASLKEILESLVVLKALGVFELENFILAQIDEGGDSPYSEEDRRLMRFLINNPIP